MNIRLTKIGRVYLDITEIRIMKWLMRLLVKFIGRHKYEKTKQ
jgi:hypothetical protein